jgi:hypothetical protein
MTESKSDLIDKIIEASKILDEADCGSEFVCIIDQSHPLYNTIQRVAPNTRIDDD